MPNLNRVMLMGRLGTDPEIRQTSRGATVANLSVATNEQWVDRGGESRRRTEWHRIVIWRHRLTKLVEERLKKGRSIYVEGSLHTREWQDSSGNTRHTTEIHAQRLQVLDHEAGETEQRLPAQESTSEPRDET